MRVRNIPTIKVPQEIIARINARTYTAWDLARHLGVPNEGVKYQRLVRILRENGARIHSGRKRLSPLRGGDPAAYAKHLDQKYAPWVPNFIAEFRRDAKRLTQPEMAVKYGMLIQKRPFSRTWVSGIFQKLGWPKPRIWRPRIRPQILPLFVRRARSFQQLCERTHLDGTTLRRLISRNGATMVPDGNAARRMVADARHHLVTMLAERGYPMGEIALILNLAIGTVARYRARPCPEHAALTLYRPPQRLFTAKPRAA